MTNVDVTHTEATKPVQHVTAEQETAISMCCDLDERIVGITGGAGTGKTFVLGHAFEAIKKANPDISTILCAPTGRAAKRIQELTGITAVTVHKLLEFPMPDDPPPKKVDPDDDDDDEPLQTTSIHEPRRNRSRPLDQRVVFVDESSMIGPTLYRQLMDAMPAKGCIRFFGDNNQLPPVEEGKPPFIEILTSRPSVELTLNFRSDDAIISNALRILRGSVPQRNDRFEVIYSEDPIRELIRFATPEFMRMDHQIIMPTRKGKFGTQRINPSLQLKFNPNGDMLRLDRFDDKEAPQIVRAGDKFLWVKNDYNLRVMNGEIGQIDWVNSEDGSLGLTTPERHVIVPAHVKTFSPYHRSVISYDPRKQIELGYAVTTHKSQGSEFDYVVYCMTSSAAFLLDRRNFYTGVTRAKSRVFVICDRKAMGYALRKGR